MDRYAVVGFPHITETAHTLCDLLKTPVNIVTIHSTKEIGQVLPRLQNAGYRMVIGDMVTNTMARELGMNAFLITSGVESLHAALEQALQENDGNQTAAARQLGIGRTTLWRYLNNEE